MKKFAVLLLILLAISKAHAKSASHVKPRVTYVYICVSNTAHKYHRYVCRGLSHCTHDIKKVTKSKAIKLGYTPCKICY